MRKYYFGQVVLMSAFVAAMPSIAAALELSAVFSDNAVLQRDMPVPVWGWDEPGAEVTVEFAAQKVTVTANQDGKWMATLRPLKMSKEPQELTVSAGGEKLTRKNILVGDVWLCGGQSNMAMTFNWKRCPCDLPDFVNPDDWPIIRHLSVASKGAEVPQERLQKQKKACVWAVCDNESFRDFTATGFFFAYTLAKELDVPIGLLNSTKGNTRIGSWVSSESIELVKDQVPRSAFRDVYNPNPCHNYNGQIAPIARFAIKGAIWYQGEANGKEGNAYFWKMQALIRGWREVWGQGDFPFYFVQLPSYTSKNEGTPAGGDGWARIREAQRRAMALPGTGMVVLTDVGDTEAEFPINLHPRNKYEVGRRLALWALANDYGRKDLVCSGPLFKSAQFEGGKAVISFDRVGGGLMAAKKTTSRSVEPPQPVKELNGFSIAGANRKWHWADAEIRGDQVVLTAREVAEPVAVRYVYTANTDHGTLYNKEGLPAAPFRTDEWAQ